MSGNTTLTTEQQNAATPAPSALSLSDQAYRVLERHIVTLQLQPGSVIN